MGEAAKLAAVMRFSSSHSRSWTWLILLFHLHPVDAQNFGLRQIGSGGGTVTRLIRLDDRAILSDTGSIYDMGQPAAPRLAGASDWTGLDLDVVGTVGYLAAGRNGLTLLDLRQSIQPTRLGGYRTSGEAQGVAVAGTRAYVAAGEGGLRVIDVTDPTRTDQIGAYPSSLAETLTANGLVLRQDLAFVAAGPDTLQILRVANPAVIQRVGGLKTGLDATAIEWLPGDKVLVSGTSGRLRAIDVTVPANPVALGEYPGVSDALDGRGIQVTGAVCYVAAGSDGILVLDWSNPAQPRLASVYRPSAPVVSVLWMGGYLLASHGGSGFSVLAPTTATGEPPEISDPPQDLAVPVGAAARFEVRATPDTGLSFQWLHGLTPMPGATSSVLTLPAVALPDAGEYRAVVSNEFGVATSAAAKLTVIPAPRIHSQPESVVRLEGQPLRLWVGATPEDGLQYQWFHNGVPLPDATGASLDLPAPTLDQAGDYSVRVSNAAGSLHSGVATVGIRPLLSLRQIGRWPAVPDQEYAARVRVIGTHAYVANGFAGLRVIDIADPSNPRQVGGHGGEGYAGGLDIAGNQLYLADGQFGGLVVLDISDPANPRRLGVYTSGRPIEDVRVSGGLAYLACGAAGLDIVDVREPAAMSRVGAFPDSYGSRALELAGSYALLADGPGGMLVVDIAAPSKPVPVAQFAKPEFGEYRVQHVHRAGALAYLSCTYEGLYIADISDPAQPRSIAYESGYAYCSRVAGSHAFIGRFDLGLRVVDVTTVREKVTVTDFDTQGEVNDIDVAGRHVFVADGKNGLLVLESSLPFTVEAPRLEIQRHGATQALRLRAPGSQTAVLQRSTDLRVWTPVQTNTPAAGTAAAEFMVEPSAATGFFRVSR